MKREGERKIKSGGDNKGEKEREKEGGRERESERLYLEAGAGRCGSSNRWKPAGWRKHGADLWLRPADEHRERARKHSGEMLPEAADWRR